MPVHNLHREMDVESVEVGNDSANCIGPNLNTNMSATDTIKSNFPVLQRDPRLHKQPIINESPLLTNDRSITQTSSWQIVPVKNRKRTNSDADSVISNNNKLSKKNETLISDSNKYNVLSNLNNDNDGNTIKKKDPNPPPIFVPGVVKIKDFVLEIETAITKDEYFLKIINRDMIKINTKTLLSHQKVVLFLKQTNKQFHTYQPRQKRAYRVVLRHVHHSTDTDQITEAITQYGHSVRNITCVLHRVTKQPLSLFYVNLEPKENNKDIYNIEFLLNMKVKFEPPHKKRNDIPQCKRCQGYFHTQSYCYHNPRCVKCGDNHASMDCSVSKKEPAKCVHCEESHPASYKGCKVYQDLVRARHTSRQTQSTQSASKTGNSASERSNSKAARFVAPEVSYSSILQGDKSQRTTTETQENDFSNLIQDTFKRFEMILIKQSEQISTLVNLLTAVITKLT